MADNANSWDIDANENFQLGKRDGFTGNTEMSNNEK